MKTRAKKTVLLLALCLCLLLAACSETKPIETGIGEFEYGQVFMDKLEDQAKGIELVPEQGNIYLVVYLTPAAGNEVTLDDADSYFLNGTKAVLAGETYDLYCLAHEQVDKSYIRFGLVFEVADNGYMDAAEQPVIQLLLPSVPE